MSCPLCSATVHHSCLIRLEVGLWKCLKYPESGKDKDKTYPRQIARGCWGHFPCPQGKSKLNWITLHAFALHVCAWRFVMDIRTTWFSHVSNSLTIVFRKHLALLTANMFAKSPIKLLPWEASLPLCETKFRQVVKHNQELRQFCGKTPCCFKSCCFLPLC